MSDPERSALAPESVDSRLRAVDLTAGYGNRVISRSLDVEIPASRFTVIIGPNACGKSTLLRTLARLLPAQDGAVLLDGVDIHSLRATHLARKLGLLPQSAIAPEGIRVIDLVGRGRYPHQGPFRQWSAKDEDAVDAAMRATGVDDLAPRLVDELSGGQRQRVWMAMALAQETPTLLLDEPTTYLDIAHQIDLLNRCRGLLDEGRTLVAVLHDLNQACRYADHLIAMKDGEVVATGQPRDIVTAELVEEVFGVRAVILDDPETGTPLVVPRAPIGRARRATDL